MLIEKAYPDLKLRLLWLSIGYALVILIMFLSLTGSPVSLAISFLNEDKFYHALAYFCLMSWFAQIYHDRFRRNMLAVIFVLMGASLEYIQSFDPNRFAEFGDMVANITGVLIALLLSLTSFRFMLVRLERIFIAP